MAAANYAFFRWGFGLASVRFICGTQRVHKELEGRLAEFLGTDDAILYSSAFDANGGVFEPLLDETCAIVSDELNHASIIDGVRLCKAERMRYRNSDMNHLEECLKEAKKFRVRIHSTSVELVLVPKSPLSLDLELWLSVWQSQWVYWSAFLLAQLLPYWLAWLEFLLPLLHPHCPASTDPASAPSFLLRPLLPASRAQHRSGAFRAGLAEGQPPRRGDHPQWHDSGAGGGVPRGALPGHPHRYL